EVVAGRRRGARPLVPDRPRVLAVRRVGVELHPVVVDRDITDELELRRGPVDDTASQTPSHRSNCSREPHAYVTIRPKRAGIRRETLADVAEEPRSHVQALATTSASERAPGSCTIPAAVRQ